MNPFNDPLNIVLLIAVLIMFWRLKSMLGQRTGFEKPPLDLTKQFKREKPVAGDEAKPIDPAPITIDEDDRRPVWDGYAKEGTAVASGIQAIADRMPGFTAKTFVQGAEMAYEMVLNAFAKGDKTALKPLLSRDVLDGFVAAIDERTRAGHKRHMEFVGVKHVEIISARLDGNRAELTLRIVGEMVAATIDAQGQTVEGNPKALREVFDTWTFERDVTARNPNWTVIDTTDDAETVV